MTFYVYENWTHTRARVHAADCPYCKGGRGIQGAETKTPNGRWLGPFASRDIANNIASTVVNGRQNRSVWSVAPCGYCGARVSG